MRIALNGVLEKVNDVTVECYRDAFLLYQVLVSDAESLGRRFYGPAYPALAESGFYAGWVNLRDDTHAIGDLDRLSLCAAHASQA